MVGGGDAAVTEALYLAELCAHVHILVRGDALRAENIWVEKANAKENITIHFNTAIEEIQGNFGVESVLLKDGSSMTIDGVFIAVGSDPDTKLLDSFGPEKDSTGCIVVDKRQATSIPGVYAA